MARFSLNQHKVCVRLFISSRFYPQVLLQFLSDFWVLAVCSTSWNVVRSPSLLNMFSNLEDLFTFFWILYREQSSMDILQYFQWPKSNVRKSGLEFQNYPSPPAIFPCLVQCLFLNRDWFVTMKKIRVFPITASSLSVYNLYIQFIKLFYRQLKYKQFWGQRLSVHLTVCV